MICSYRDAETRRLMERQASLKYKNVERTALIRLRFLNAATSLSDLRLPGLHLEPLKADRKGQYSIRINDRYPNLLRVAGWRCLQCRDRGLPLEETEHG